MNKLNFLRSSSERSAFCFGLGLSTGVLLSLGLLCGGYRFLPDWEYLLRALWNDSTILEGGAKVRELEQGDIGSEGDSGALLCRRVVDVPLHVLPFQIDRNHHMNNARYVYELNFTRRYAFNRLGIAQFVKENGGNLIIQAQTIRYRKELRMGDKYIVRTSIIGWSDRNKCFYVESRFLNQQENFVLAIHVAKYRIVSVHGRHGMKQLDSAHDFLLLTPSKILAVLHLVAGDLIVAEHLPPEISLWEKYNIASSQVLNPHKSMI